MSVPLAQIVATHVAELARRSLRAAARAPPQHARRAKRPEFREETAKPPRIAPWGLLLTDPRRWLATREKWLRRQDSNTSGALNASASKVIHDSATVENASAGGALGVSKGGERNPRCTNVPNRPVDPVAGALRVLLEGWDQAQDASKLRRGLLALLTTLDP
jgi:hypothetical protein